MKHRLGSLIVAGIIFLFVGIMAPTPVGANDGHIPLVTRTLGGVTTTNLDDNFESPVSGNTPNNGSFPGSWTVTTGSGSTVQNWDASLSPNLAAFQGNQYVRLSRPGGGFSLLGGTFGVGETPTSFTTGKLQIQFALRVTTYTPDFQAGVELDAGSFNDPDIRFSLVTKSDGSIHHYVTGSTYTPTGITGFSTNDWQRWLIDVDLDNNRYNLTVDNQSAFNLPFFTTGPNPTSRLLFSAGNTGAQMFIDALPEPTAMTLLGVSGLLLLRRRR